MKRNLISFGKIFASLGLSALLFITSCKEKERNFEEPCTAPAAPHAGNNSPVQLNAEIQFTAESISGATYSWSGPGGFSSSEQNPVLTFTKAAQAGEYSVTITVDGCISEPGYTYVSSCIAAPRITITNFSRSNGDFVYGDTVSFEGAFNTNATFRWDRPTANDTLVQNFTIYGLKSTDIGTYKYNMTFPNGTFIGCTTPDSAFTIVLKPYKPKITGTGVGVTGGAINDVNSTYIDTINGTLNMSATGTPGATFVWSGPDGFSATTAAVQINNLTRAAQGTYYVHSILNGLHGDSVGRKVIIRYANTPCGTDTSVTDLVTGQVYKIVQLVGRCWTKENIRKAGGVETFSWAELKAPTVVDSQSVCPARWHVASDPEYTLLSNLVANDGNALKDVIQEFGGGTLGTNTSGFSVKMNINLGKSVSATAPTLETSTTIKVANTTGLIVGKYVKIATAPALGVPILPPGTTITAILNATQFTISNPPDTTIKVGHIIALQDLHAFFWTSTTLTSNYAWYRQLYPDNGTILRNTQDLSVVKSYSVRCVRD